MDCRAGRLASASRSPGPCACCAAKSMAAGKIYLEQAPWSAETGSRDGPRPRGGRERAHCCWMPANLITFAHFSVSRAMSAGGTGSGEHSRGLLPSEFISCSLILVFCSAGLDRRVQLGDDLGRRALGRADAARRARLEAGQGRRRASARPGSAVDLVVAGSRRAAAACRLCGSARRRRPVRSNITWTCPVIRSVSAGVEAAIGHVGQLHAAHHLEELAAEMRRVCRCRPTPC